MHLTLNLTKLALRPFAMSMLAITPVTNGLITRKLRSR